MILSIRRNLALLLCGVLCLAGTVSRTDAAEDRAKPKVPYTAAGRTRAGRDIKATGDTPLGVRVRDDTVSVVIGNHTMVVEKKRILLDGKARAKISASVRTVDIVCSNSTVTVMADKKSVLTAKINE